jgi:alkyl sulfatase BDS1-like metallo-beta-lactamase superfamily hydrolase
VDAAARYIDLAGGADAALHKAQQAYDAADYRWVAQLLNHLVFFDPDNAGAKSLLATTYDQLGYQAESGPWRDVYLTAAYELRHGPPEQGLDIASTVDVLRRTPVQRFFDAMAVRLNGPDAEGVKLSVKIEFTDLEESYLLQIGNSVLRHRLSLPKDQADATLKLTHEWFILVLTGKAQLQDLLFSEEIELEGSKIDLARFFSLLDKPEARFNIVTP